MSAPTLREMDISLSLRMTTIGVCACPMWLSASNAMPPESAASPISATTLLSVSYTQLDVYKRQDALGHEVGSHAVEHSTGRRLDVARAVQVVRAPVSYTHLDVYKRQLPQHADDAAQPTVQTSADLALAEITGAYRSALDAASRNLLGPIGR